VRFSDGTFGVMTSVNGAVEYHQLGPSHRIADSETAHALCDQLNGRPALPRRCTMDEFKRMTEHVKLTPQMRGALLNILVVGHTWRQCAEVWAVTESGILRALRRVASANLVG
jgi:hypothetical protein